MNVCRWPEECDPIVCVLVYGRVTLWPSERRRRIEGGEGLDKCHRKGAKVDRMAVV